MQQYKASVHVMLDQDMKEWVRNSLSETALNVRQTQPQNAPQFPSCDTLQRSFPVARRQTSHVPRPSSHTPVHIM